MTRAPQIRIQLEPDEIIVDNFAGGGGASTGIEAALGRPVDIAINHDAEAIAMHKANHPETRHYCEDVWSVDPREVCGRRRVRLLWLSPDCKHFSKAKGGRPVEKRIRALAWIAVRWVKALPERQRPAVIMLENVEEFQDWGPLTDEGLPDPERKGQTFKRWLGTLRNLGYRHELAELRACDYGAPTSRRRLFVILRRDSLPIIWPEATHGAGRAFTWRTAAECIDFSHPCPSIFERRRPLAPNTMRRVAEGVRRYVLTAADPFIVPVKTWGGGGNGPGSVHDPLRTITGSKRGEFALVQPFMMKNMTNNTPRPVDAPLSTILTGNHHYLVAPTLVQTGYGERSGQAPRVPGLHKPLGTIIADGGGKHALVAAFLSKQNGVGKKMVVGQGLKEPVHTITAKDQKAVVSANLVKLYGTSIGQDVREPMPTITAGGGKGGGHIAAVYAFLTQYYGEGGGQHADVREPMRTIRSHDCMALVQVHGEPHVIADIGLRMLTPRELFRAQGFPEDYEIDPLFEGEPLTKTAQIRMVGNSVPPDVAEALVRANLAPLVETRIAA